ncbi:MAG: outer membrane lipoprotein-sorting protein [Pyrinomonadaceae bacterium]
MKNSFQYVLASIALAFVFGAVTQANAQGPEAIRLLYQKMDKNLQTLTSLKTGIRMEKYNVQLKDYDDRREGVGMFIPIKKSKSVNFRLDWTKGAQESLSVVNGEYKLYQPRLGQVIVGKNKEVQKNDNAGSIFKLINMSAKDLKTNFNANWLGQEVVANVHSAYKIQLTPKTQMNFDHAEVWVNEDGMVVQIKVYEKNNDWTNVLLFDIQKNAPITLKEIALNPPKGTKIVKS